VKKSWSSAIVSTLSQPSVSEALARRFSQNGMAAVYMNAPLVLHRGGVMLATPRRRRQRTEQKST
jgi:hypothetical protein